MKIFAILGASASGKSALGLRLAKELDCFILSLDSLSIYQEINIASAKPSKEELLSIRHFGIDLLTPNEPSNAALFARLFEEALEASNQAGKKALLLVGGTGFFLKRIIEGLSPAPTLDPSAKEWLKEVLENRREAFKELEKIDPLYTSRITPSDLHRLRRGWEIYLGSGLSPSLFFETHPPKPLGHDLKIYELALERELLRQRITERTEQMLESGLIDEVCQLESRYTREPQAMKSIGIAETLAYLDGEISKEELIPLISTHTAQLAKRQTTFNKTQFTSIRHLEAPRLFEEICHTITKS